MPKSASILIIAGEPSGDLHGARLVRAIRAQRPDLTFYGIGGDAMAAEGVALRWHVRDMAVMGFTEVLARYGFFRRVFHQMLHEVKQTQPIAVILIDYPGFNLRFAARVHGPGTKVIYYICPQVWAWGRGRIPKMARDIDRLITIFPFEKKHFRGTGLNVEFVGHPLVDEAGAVFTAPMSALPWQGEPRVALLPGSRKHEIERILPTMWRAAGCIQSRCPEASFILAAAKPEQEALIRRVVARLSGGPSRWSIVTEQTTSVLRQAKATMVASGTATIETALMRCPMVICYRVSALSYMIGRWLIKVPYIGMVNIVAGKKICPELVQSALTPEKLCEAMMPLLHDGIERGRMLQGLDEVKEKLGSVGAVDRAAHSVLEEIHGGTEVPL
jgi:lipid-A-disaccharide synthase